MAQPIKPDEVVSAKLNTIPDEVINIVNFFLAKNWTGGSAIIELKDIVKLIKERLSECDYSWLNFEEIYREVGWRVSYHQPAYNESFNAYFEFRKRK